MTTSAAPPVPGHDELDELLDVAQECARAGAAVALDWRQRASDLTVEHKSGPSDLVSQADREAEDAVRAVLARRRPDDGVLGEEHGRDELRGSRYVWVVDPIDGTTNYLYGRDDWAVSVAVVQSADGDGLGAVLAGVVAEPAVRRTTWARVGGGAFADGRPTRVSDMTDLSLAVVEVGLGRPPLRERSGRLMDALVPLVRDLRRGGSAACALAQVATGRAEASWGPSLAPWDLAAGTLVVREAGGIAGELTGPVQGRLPEGDVLAAGPALFEQLRALLADVYR